MTALPAAPKFDQVAILRHDPVSVPDGRVGEVIGFYRERESDEQILVLLKTGTERYHQTDLRLHIGDAVL